MLNAPSHAAASTEAEKQYLGEIQQEIAFRSRKVIEKTSDTCDHISQFLEGFKFILAAPALEAFLKLIYHFN